MRVESPHRRITTLTWAFVGGGVIAAGLILIFWSSTLNARDQPIWKTFAGDVGSVLLATGSISVLWELVTKRSFVSEVFSVARLSEDVKRAGLQRLTTNFQHDVEWPELLNSARKIDVFFSYARTWRNNNLSFLHAFAERSGSQMTVILPDPEDDLVMQELARRYEAKPETIKERVDEAIKEYARIFDKKRGAKGQLAIWVVAKAPVFTFYRIDKKYVVAMYRHRPGRGEIPTIVCDRKGEITEFIDSEIEFLTDESVSGVRKVFPPPKELPPGEPIARGIAHEQPRDETQLDVPA